MVGNEERESEWFDERRRVGDALLPPLLLGGTNQPSVIMALTAEDQRASVC